MENCCWLAVSNVVPTYNTIHWMVCNWFLTFILLSTECFWLSIQSCFVKRKGKQRVFFFLKILHWLPISLKIKSKVYTWSTEPYPILPFLIFLTSSYDSPFCHLLRSLLASLLFSWQPSSFLNQILCIGYFLCWNHFL